jgi:hypothetical protein
MALDEIKAHCEEHESRTDGLHAKMDKLKEDSEGPTSGKTTRIMTGKVLATVAIAAVLVGAGFWLLTRSGPNDIINTYPPVIDSSAFVKNPNGMRVWINATDSDDFIVNVTVHISVKAQGNNSYLWPPVLEKVYWVNASSVHIADTILLGNLPAGGYRISAFATDTSGRVSDAVGFTEFVLP